MSITLPAPNVQDPAAQQNFEYLASGVSWPGTSIGTGTITGGSGGNIGQGTITGGPGGNIAATSITANELSVTQLSAITANMGTLTSGTITGATVRSGATGARWEGDAGGLRGYKADGVTLSFGINTADGSAIFSGTVAAGSGSSGLSNISGQVGTTQVADGAITVLKLNVLQLSAITADMGTLTAGVIQGATIRTAPTSGSRVEMSSAGLKFYESDGVTVAVDLSSAGQGLNLLAGTTGTPPNTRQINWYDGGGNAASTIMAWHTTADGKSNTNYDTIGDASKLSQSTLRATTRNHSGSGVGATALLAAIADKVTPANTKVRAQVVVDSTLFIADLLNNSGNSSFPGTVTVGGLGKTTVTGAPTTLQVINSTNADSMATVLEVFGRNSITRSKHLYVRLDPTDAAPKIILRTDSGAGSAPTLGLAGGNTDTPVINMGATTLSFFNGTLASKPTVTGSRAGNAALASALSALSSLGLLADSSTA